MNEKDLAILEQYDLQVNSSRRGRGSYLLETDQGPKLLTEFSGTERRLQFQNRICEEVSGGSPVRVDRVLENKEGSLITRDREERGFIVKDWFDGRELNVRSEEEVMLAIRVLARLHKVMCLPGDEEPKEQAEARIPDQERFRGMPLETECAKKTRELKKVRTYMRGRNPKNPFERQFLDTFDLFFSQAAEVTKASGTDSFSELYEKSMAEGRICHGDYNQHHIFLSGSETAVMDFSRARYDLQIIDLYQFLRKIMEKQNWDLRLGTRMLDEYSRVRAISKPELANLRLRMNYPEKFWKLANHYYNSRKSRMPEKGLEKIGTLINQEERRQAFLRRLG